MTLGWVITGTIFQLLLAYFMFLLVVFGFSAIGSTHRPKPFDFVVLDSAIYSVPASCGLSALIVIGLFNADAGAFSYRWYALPLVVFASYLLYIRLFVQRLHRAGG